MWEKWHKKISSVDEGEIVFANDNLMVRPLLILVCLEKGEKFYCLNKPEIFDYSQFSKFKHYRTYS